MINAQNTQNENDAEKITLQVPEQYEKQAENVPLEERLSTAEAVIAEILGGEV